MCDRPVLYSFRRCPYAMRARMALLASGTTVRLREVLLRDKPGEMLALSPKGTVPVLHIPAAGDDGGGGDDRGRVIDESLAVMRWALARRDPDNWLAAERRDPETTNALISDSDGPFKHNLDRYKYSTRYAGADRDSHREAGAVFLRRLDDRLRPAGQLFGAAISLADIAIFPFVRQFRIADPAWFDAQDWDALKAWLSGHMESEVFRMAMIKFAPWKETGRDEQFPQH